MLRHIVPAVISVLIITALCCFAFPFVITTIAQAAFHEQANGSLIIEEGRVIGSELIGQDFTTPGYFHPRPSAAGAGYDAANSGGTNLAPTSDKLINGMHRKLPNGDDDPADFDGITDLVKAYREENYLPPDALVPVDAVTRSASGLDPHISPANARIQAVRVARVRGVPEDDMLLLVAKHTEGRLLGLLGEPHINVLLLNLELDKVYGAPRQ